MNKISLNKLVGMIALAVPAVLLSAETAFARDNYGALAFSKSTGASAYSRNYATRAAASRAARTECKRYSGTNDCITVVTGRNTCLAIASASNRAYGWSRNTSLSKAQVIALENCSKNGRYCKIRHAVCSRRSRR